MKLTSNNKFIRVTKIKILLDVKDNMLIFFSRTFNLKKLMLCIISNFFYNCAKIICLTQEFPLFTCQKLTAMFGSTVLRHFSYINQNLYASSIIFPLDNATIRFYHKYLLCLLEAPKKVYF